MPTLPLALPFQSRESYLFPTQGLPHITIVFGYLGSHLQASRIAFSVQPQKQQPSGFPPAVQ